ncbi:MAG: hypothetical protein LBB76_12570 [Azoarcus sp.]|nr:hypothetical protein [Azoarcus sp.]
MHFNIRPNDDLFRLSTRASGGHAARSCGQVSRVGFVRVPLSIALGEALFVFPSPLCGEKAPIHGTQPQNRFHIIAKTLFVAFPEPHGLPRLFASQ